MKKFKPVILTAILIALVLSVISFWVPQFEYAFFGYLILAGCFFVWIQKENRTGKFLGKLLIGAVSCGLLMWLLIFFRMYALSRLVYDVPLPFRELWDMANVMMGVIFMIVGFIGGLIGIVFKGFYDLYKEKLDKMIILIGPLVVLFSSLAVYKIKTSGTVMSSLHGWPYPFWIYQIKDIIDGFAIDKWIFSPGSICHCIVFNYLFFLAIFILVYFLINFLNRKISTRKINTTLFLFGVLVLIVLIFTTALPFKKSYIQKQIDWGGECSREADCVIVANRSPFSCAVVANKENADRILNLINTYPSTGELACSGNEKATCIQNKCRISIDHTSNETFWDMLKNAIEDCRVESIMQAHSLEVKAILKNGMVINAIEPRIDDIFDIVEQNKEKCGEIGMMTE